jgi:hypothetical protein
MKGLEKNAFSRPIWGYVDRQAGFSLARKLSKTARFWR